MFAFVRKSDFEDLILKRKMYICWSFKAENSILVLNENDGKLNPEQKFIKRKLK